MKHILPSLVASVLLTACGNKTAENKAVQNDPNTPTSNAPVETEAPNSDLKPAFTGQTRIAGVTTKTPYEGKVVTDKLDRPWGVTALPDGRLLVTEKGGTMRIVTKDGTVSKKITGLPEVNDSGQGGLLG
ncbi:MAG: PQQ-dependent sugar dehydrogenase, partial [Flavobacterium sp.]